MDHERLLALRKGQRKKKKRHSHGSHARILEHRHQTLSNCKLVVNPWGVCQLPRFSLHSLTRWPFLGLAKWLLSLALFGSSQPSLLAAGQQTQQAGFSISESQHEDMICVALLVMIYSLWSASHHSSTHNAPEGYCGMITPSVHLRSYTASTSLCRLTVC